MSEIDKLCDNFFLETLRLEPESAIMFGLQDKLDDPNIYSDFSPKGRDKYVRLCKNYIQKVNNIVCQDIKQNIVKQQFLLVLNSSLNMEEKWHDSLRFMNNLFSPFQSLRTVFDLMPRHTTQDFVNVLNRLKNIPKAVDSYIESLELGLNENIVNTKRQCLIIIEQIKTQLNSRTSFFQKMINEAKAENINFEVIEKITKQIELVFKSFVKLQQFLEIQYLPKANLDDAVGKQRYLNYSAHYVGQKIDLDEAYQWGVEQIDEIIEQQFSLAKSFGVKSINKIQAIKQAAKILNNLDNQAIIGADNLQKYMQNIADSTMKYLITNNHFDIPKPIQKIQAMIVPTGDGVVYYTPPSADFSIPGRMWWSIPTGVKKQYKWNSKTTIFHEGVPGHHLQVGLQVYLKDKLNDWQRMGLLISGYAEGWALYAEKLMDEFGMLDNYEKFGMLDMQRFRAARIIIDIGVHCKMFIPKHWQKTYGQGIWDYNKAKRFLADMVNMNQGFQKFELDRYMGIPGQAISYKLGQRSWLNLRDKALTKGWKLKDFHTQALSFGCLSFDLLDKALFE